jgi:hypothetical protein
MNAYAPPYDPHTLGVLAAAALTRYYGTPRQRQLALPLDEGAEPAQDAQRGVQEPRTAPAAAPASSGQVCWACGAPAERVTCGQRACRLARRRFTNGPSHQRQNVRRRDERHASPAVRRPTKESPEAIERRYQQAKAWRRYQERLGARPVTPTTTWSQRPGRSTMDGGSV